MRIARGGELFIAGSVGLLLAAVAFLQDDLSALSVALCLLALLTLLLFLWFFRDPFRRPSMMLDEDVAVAPADGRVIEAEEGQGGPVLTLYLNLLNVHVTRLPLDSAIVQVDRIEGSYRLAGNWRAGENARLVTECRTSAGPMQITQFVGFLARRIVPYLTPGQKGERGARLGLIRFGSRVRVGFPSGYSLLVRPGMDVRAGETPVARLSNPETVQEER